MIEFNENFTDETFENLWNELELKEPKWIKPAGEEIMSNCYVQGNMGYWIKVRFRGNLAYVWIEEAKAKRSGYFDGDEAEKNRTPLAVVRRDGTFDLQVTDFEFEKWVRYL